MISESLRKTANDLLESLYKRQLNLLLSESGQISMKHFCDACGMNRRKERSKRVAVESRDPFKIEE